MKKTGLFARIIVTVVTACMLAAFLPVNGVNLTAEAATSTSKNCPPNLRPAIVPGGRTYVSLNGNSASKTVTFCQYFGHNKAIKVWVDDKSVASVSYKVAGSTGSGRYVFISVKFKKIDDVFVYFNAPLETTTMSLPIIPNKYNGEVKSLKIGSKTYNTSKSFSFTGDSFKNQKVTVKAKKGMSVDYLYVVDNYERAKKNSSQYTIKKKYKNGAKVTVPAGCALHAVFNTGNEQLRPDFCLYTANGSTSDKGETSSSSSSKNKDSGDSGTEKPAKMTISKSYNTSTNPEYPHGVRFVWKKQDVSGYQIQASFSKSFSNPPMNKYIPANMTAHNIGLDKGARIYFRIRAFNEVNGKRVYGPWSAVATQKAK